MKKFVLLVLNLLVLIGFATHSTVAQNYLTQVGNPTFSTSIPVMPGSLNVANGDLQLAIPLGSFPQRHGPPLTFALVYDSRIWAATGSWQPTNVPGWGGWRMVSNGATGSVTHNTLVRNCARIGLNGSLTTYSNFVWTAPDGTSHVFAAGTENTQNEGDCFEFPDEPTGSGSATDATGYYIAITSYTTATVYAPDGTEVYPVHVDPDGNSFSGSTSIVDQLGRTPVTTTSNCNGNSNQTCYTILTSQGSGHSATVTVTTESIPYHTNFGQSGITESSGNLTVIQSILLPDTTQYSFSYDSGTTAGHYAELTGITLPTGGAVTYGYTNFADYSGSHNEWLSSYVAGGGTWTFTPLVGGTCNVGYLGCQEVTILKPSGDNVVYMFGINNGSWAGQIQYYSGSISTANLQETVADVWGLVNPGTFEIQKVSETLTLPVPGGTSVNRTTKYTYDSIWDTNIATISEWKYYTGTLPTSPDRTTTITYQASTFFATPNIVNRPLSVTVNAGSTQLAQTKFVYDTHGNQTQIQQWTGGSNYLTTILAYDTYGHVHTAQDPNGNATTFTYTDCFRTDNGANPAATYTATPATNAYLTSITLPASGSINKCYYFNTGKMASLVDQNGADSYWHFIDSMDRLTNSYGPPVAGGNRGWGLAQYTGRTQVDAYSSISSTSPSSSCSSCEHNETILDNLGRATTQELVNDPDGLTQTVVSYDTNGRALDGTNPYRTTLDPTYGLNTPTYDGLDRVTKATDPDGDFSQTYFGAGVAGTGLGGLTTQLCPSSTYGVGFPVLAIDEAGKKRELWTDGFGKTIEVDQPNSIGNLAHNVCYTYDLLGNSMQVVDGTQTRSYSYDTLSRATQVTTPESGSVHLYYTTSAGALCAGSISAVCRRTDARSITTTYAYDALNRLTGKTYSDTTHAVGFSYDQASYNGLTISNGLGRRTGMSDGSGTTAWSYDAAGNIVTERRTIAGITKPISYAYNLDGSLNSVTYPNGRVVNYNIGNAERPISATDANGSQYAAGASYAPTGGLLGVIYGKVTGGFGGITEADAYNSRLEYASTQTSSTAGTPLNLAFCNGTYSFASGCSSPSTNNNTNISGLTNAVDNGRSENATYDPLSRIASTATQATSGSDCWGQSFTIDGLANLTGMTVTQCTAGSLSVTANASNQLVSTGFTYDAAGNMTGDGSYAYTFDAENRITSANGITYTYDGNGLRVEKSNGTLYWRVLTGIAVAETDLAGNTKSEYVFFSGRRIARIDSSANVYYYYADQVGTTQAITTSTGILCYDAEFTPFGQEIAHTNSCGQNYKFTGYERDAETGLDYAFARYYNPRLGRFMSADPLGGDLSDPQSLNRYAYVENNPQNYIDPSGMRPLLYTPVPQSWVDGFSYLTTFNFNSEGLLVLYTNLDSWMLGNFGPIASSDDGSDGSIPHPTCTFNIFVNKSFLYDGSDQKNFQQNFLSQLGRIFGDAGVGINLVGSPGNADFVIGLALSGSGSGSEGADVLGEAIGTNGAAIYLGNMLAMNPHATPSQMGFAAGQVASHEIGHDLYPGQPHPHNPSPDNIMAETGDPFGQTYWFPAGNEADILAKCLAKRSSQ